VARRGFRGGGGAGQWLTMGGVIPNPLHPALVHFPLVLTLVGLLLDLAARHQRGRNLEPAAPVLMALAGATAIAAWLSGRAAEQRAVVPAEAVALLERHEILGAAAMIAVVAVAAARIVLAAQRRPAGRLAWIYLAAAAGAVLLVLVTAAAGGDLVFRHGVGTAPLRQPLP
jgi:uncharacterized membrane protein